MKDGSPIKAYKWAVSQELVSRSEFSRSMSLAKFVPDSITLNKLLRCTLYRVVHKIINIHIILKKKITIE
jgi:hypothetical protein